MYFLFYKVFHRKIQNNKQYFELNKNKNAYFKKFHHSEALFSMALMGHILAPTMRIMKMFADCRIFVSSSTLKKVWGSLGDIICIAQADHIQNDKQRIVD